MRFHIAGPLLRFCDYEAEIECTAQSLDVAFEELFQRHPDLRRVLTTADGSVRGTHAVFLNDELIHDREGVTVSDSDSVLLFTALAGG